MGTVNVPMALRNMGNNSATGCRHADAATGEDINGEYLINAKERTLLPESAPRRNYHRGSRRWAKMQNIQKKACPKYPS
ncbi:MAG: hypothetical protein ACLU4N_20875 [Butyricimonas faecihominis]